MGAFNYWFSFSGRIGRAQWWLRRIGLGLIVAAVAIVGVGAMTTGGETDVGHSLAGQVLVGVLMVVYLASWLAIQARRWHDLGKSGWWQLMALIPLVGGIYVLVMCGFVRGDNGDNDYGRDPLDKSWVS